MGRNSHDTHHEGELRQAQAAPASRPVDPWKLVKVPQYKVQHRRGSRVINQHCAPGGVLGIPAHRPGPGALHDQGHHPVAWHLLCFGGCHVARGVVVRWGSFLLSDGANRALFSWYPSTGRRVRDSKGSRRRAPLAILSAHVELGQNELPVPEGLGGCEATVGGPHDQLDELVTGLIQGHLAPEDG